MMGEGHSADCPITPGIGGDEASWQWMTVGVPVHNDPRTWWAGLVMIDRFWDLTSAVLPFHERS